jgi:hypothetical protein
VDKDLARVEAQVLVDTYPDAGNITIYEIGTVDSLSKDNDNSYQMLVMSGRHWLVDYAEDAIKTYTRRNYFESDRFMDSCAKGEKKTIKKTISTSLSWGCSGDQVYNLDVNYNLTYSIVRGQELVGPPESSAYNSREFRVKFYEIEVLGHKIYIFKTET